MKVLFDNEVVAETIDLDKGTHFRHSSFISAGRASHCISLYLRILMETQTEMTENTFPLFPSISARGYGTLGGTSVFGTKKSLHGLFPKGQFPMYQGLLPALKNPYSYLGIGLDPELTVRNTQRKSTPLYEFDGPLYRAPVPNRPALS